MALPPRLDKELEETRQTIQVEVVEEPETINLVFRNFPLGTAFNPTNADLLVRLPRSYPDTGPDMFWTHPEVKLANGQVPQSSEQFETYVNRQWRRFSWHRQGWNPSVDNLHGYMEFIRKRLREGK